MNLQCGIPIRQFKNLGTTHILSRFLAATTDCQRARTPIFLAIGQIDIARASRLHGDQAMMLPHLALWQRLRPPQVCGREEKNYAC